MKTKPDYICKVVIVGNSNVGKSNLLRRIDKDQFELKTATTIGLDIVKKIFRTEDNKLIELCFWDTAGQEHYRNLTKMYFKASDAIVYVCSVDSKQSFMDLKYWVSEAENLGVQKCAQVLLANKIDLEEEFWQVDRNYGPKVRDQINYRRQSKNLKKQKGYDLQFFQVSAKTGQNIDIFLNCLYGKIRDKKIEEDPLGKRPIFLSDTESIRTVSKDKKGKCC